MALVDLNDVTVWETLYTGGFVRANKDRIGGDDQWSLLAGSWLWAVPNARVLIIGAGFGWIAEDWISVGYAVTCTDTSAWIQANKGDNAVVPILDLNVMVDTEREQLLVEHGPFDVAVIEDVDPCYSDEDALALAHAARLCAPIIVHWISCAALSSPGGLNWKTVEDWKTLLAPDVVVPRGAGAA